MPPAHIPQQAPAQEAPRKKGAEGGGLSYPSQTVQKSDRELFEDACSITEEASMDEERILATKSRLNGILSQHSKGIFKNFDFPDFEKTYKVSKLHLDLLCLKAFLEPKENNFSSVIPMASASQSDEQSTLEAQELYRDFIGVYSKNGDNFCQARDDAARNLYQVASTMLHRERTWLEGIMIYRNNFAYNEKDHPAVNVARGITYFWTSLGNVMDGKDTPLDAIRSVENIYIANTSFTLKTGDDYLAKAVSLSDRIDSNEVERIESVHESVIEDSQNAIDNAEGTVTRLKVAHGVGAVAASTAGILATGNSAGADALYALASTGLSELVSESIDNHYRPEDQKKSGGEQLKDIAKKTAINVGIAYTLGRVLGPGKNAAVPLTSAGKRVADMTMHEVGSFLKSSISNFSPKQAFAESIGSTAGFFAKGAGKIEEGGKSLFSKALSYQTFHPSYTSLDYLFNWGGFALKGLKGLAVKGWGGLKGLWKSKVSTPWGKWTQSLREKAAKEGTKYGAEVAKWLWKNNPIREFGTSLWTATKGTFTTLHGLGKRVTTETIPNFFKKTFGKNAAETALDTVGKGVGNLSGTLLKTSIGSAGKNTDEEAATGFKNMVTAAYNKAMGNTAEEAGKNAAGEVMEDTAETVIKDAAEGTTKKGSEAMTKEEAMTNAAEERAKLVEKAAEAERKAKEKRIEIELLKKQRTAEIKKAKESADNASRELKDLEDKLTQVQQTIGDIDKTIAPLKKQIEELDKHLREYNLQPYIDYFKTHNANKITKDDEWRRMWNEYNNLYTKKVQETNNLKRLNAELGNQTSRKFENEELEQTLKGLTDQKKKEFELLKKQADYIESDNFQLKKDIDTAIEENENFKTIESDSRQKLIAMRNGVAEQEASKHITARISGVSSALAADLTASEGQPESEKYLNNIIPYVSGYIAPLGGVATTVLSDAVGLGWSYEQNGSLTGGDAAGVPASFLPGSYTYGPWVAPLTNEIIDEITEDDSEE